VAKTVFEDTYNVFLTSCREKGRVQMDDLIVLIKMMQENDMDCHIAIAGQNGCGKSYLLQMLLKQYILTPDWQKNLMLADKTVDDFVQFMLKNENTMLAVDEMNLFLYYKEHQAAEQNHLIKQLELARSNRIAVAGCIRDPRKLTLNYRQGKLSIVLWLVDRYVSGGSYAAVFVSNPAVETQDKFGFNWLAMDIIDFEELRVSFESLPSFIGYMSVPNAGGILTHEEVSRYKKMKAKAMAMAHMNYCCEKLRKRSMGMTDFMRELEQLEGIIPREDMEALILRARNKMPKASSAARQEEE
jgi:hypothetical protein